MLPTKKLLSTIITTSVLSFGAATTATAAEPVCEVNRTINFGGMSWESNLVLTDVHRFILENGYGCKTDTLPTESLPALAALERGDLDVSSEVWPNNLGNIWDKVEMRGKVIRSGEIFLAHEAWYIPKYTQERFPDLKSVADLPKYKDEFTDPENPSKGRFYGCPAGWSCEVSSSNLFDAYDLGDTFTYYQPGTGSAQKAALISDYRRKNNIVFYYWSPTPLVGLLDLVELKLPDYNKEKFLCLTDVNCENPEPSGYPASPAFIALNKKFAEEAPTLKAYFDSNKIPLDVLNSALAEMEKTGDDSVDIAKWFLTEHPEVWTEWVPEDVAERVQAAL